MKLSSAKLLVSVTCFALIVPARAATVISTIGQLPFPFLEMWSSVMAPSSQQ